MAEYMILAVGYSDEEQHIDWALIARPDEKGDFVAGGIIERELLADLITTEAASFKTAIVNPSSGKFRRGADVHVIGEKFISTDPNDVTRDNLGELPRFEMSVAEINMEEMFPGLAKK